MRSELKTKVDMVNRWASPDISGTGDVFRALHSGLTVNLIATSLDELKTCAPQELVSDVIDRNPEDFDFIPVVDERGRFIGMFDAADQRDRRTLGTIWQCYAPLTEEYLIGADASILDFVLDADQKPCRLVVSGAKIVGLVSLSDLQRLPARAALFALITGFEMTMADSIRKEHPSDCDWQKFLSKNRQLKIQEEKAKSKAGDSYVDSLLFTQFCDKREILKQQFSDERRDPLGEALIRIEGLRNNVAHANEYASSPSQAKGACEVVRELLKLRDELQLRTNPI
jgi:CBS domain-containing protein